MVFDLDGTLVDTAADIHAVLAEVMGEEGLPTPPLAAMRGMIGDGAKVLIERAFAAAGVTPDPDRLDELYALFLERYTAEPCRHSTLYPGAAELLGVLAAEGCGSASAPTSRSARRAAPRGARGSGTGSAPSSAATPAGPQARPRASRGRADRLDAGPETAVMVGDSRNDLLTAQAAGVPCILVSFGYTAVPARELGAEAVIDRLADLPQVLRAGTAHRVGS